MPTLRVVSFGLLCAGIAAACFAPALVAQAPKAPAPQAVESDMHEFMEYLFQPGYKRLKAAMAQAPANNAGWKQIKGDALTLAEAANLLIARQPDEQGPAWAALAVQVRDSGSAFYAVAKKKDYPAARKHYEAMLKNCNACHNKFADGEHQLTP